MTDGEKCGLTSILPMSCRGRAEAFARRLHSRLRSLGSQDDNSSSDETSWLGATENPIALSQPRHDAVNDVYIDFGLLESPGSPDEDDEEEENEIKQLINADNLRAKQCRSNSNDSDSDGPFFDTEDKTFSCNGVSSAQDLSLVSLKDDDDDLPSLETCELCDDDELNIKLVNGDTNAKCEVEITINGGNVETDDDIEEERTPRVRRCSSLKTGKTPPSTPGRKKIVRFADALGLDLADVRTFLDEIPKVPNSAYEDLSVDLNESPCSGDGNGKFQGIRVDKILMPLFQQPSGLFNFLDLVRERQVCLENAIVDDPLLLSIKGIVRVRNLDFHKSVHIRYTLNSWKSFADVQATYVNNSCDGFSDKFSFILYAHTLSVGQKLEFACRFQCKGCQYWDNNHDKNYCFQCLPATNNTPGIPLTQADEWGGGASFYYRQDNVEDDDNNRMKDGELKTNLTTIQVQDYIWRTLNDKKNHNSTENNNNNTNHSKRDILIVFVVLMFSILFLYLQKAIYFMT